MRPGYRAEVASARGGAEFTLRLRRGRRLAASRTLKVLRADADGHDLRVLHSPPGGKVPASAAGELMALTARLAGALRAVEPEAPLYWLAALSEEGERAAFEGAFADVWPRPGRTTPPKAAALHAALAAGLASSDSPTVLTEFSEANLKGAAKDAYKAGFTAGLGGLLAA